MTHHPVRVAFHLLTAFALASMSGCTNDDGGGGSTTAVQTTLTSATLAEDCGGSARGFADEAGACAEGSECPSFCQQTSVQLSFDATELDTAVPVEIVAVRLLDAESGAMLETLEARSPQLWQNESYVSWNGQLEAGAEVRASYQLSAPDWNAIGGSGFRSYERRFVLEVTVRIDGVDQKVRSAELTREPIVAT